MPRWLPLGYGQDFPCPGNARRLKTDDQLGHGGFELFGIPSAQDQVGAIQPLGEEGVTAQAKLGMGLGHGLERRSYGPLAGSLDPDGPRDDHRTGAQAGPDIFQHAAHDLGHAGQDKDIADGKARRTLNRVLDQIATNGHPGHATAGGIELNAPAGAHHGDNVRMLDQLDPEGGGDGIGGNVIMGGAYTAGGDHIVVAGAQGIEGCDNVFHDIGDGARLSKVDPVDAQIAGNVAQVGILGAARQNLIADDQHGCCHDILTAWTTHLKSSVLSCPLSAGTRLAYTPQVMDFSHPLLSGTLIRRYKRFLADVVLADGREITAHCPNPGAMLGMNMPGLKVWVSVSDNPRRKLAHTLELVAVDGTLVGVNTAMPNRLVAEALAAGLIPELAGYATHQAEVGYGDASRADFRLSHPQRAACWVEVKGVTLHRGEGLAEWPDCVSARAVRHLEALEQQVALGARAVVLFVVQRQDCSAFDVCDDLDPVFAKRLRAAARLGVEVLCYACQISPERLRLARPLPWRRADQETV